MTEAKFFVYGSMSEGFVHFNRIRDFVSSTTNATVQGTVYRLKVGFPVLLEDGVDCIPGQLVTLKASDLLINLLDEFHGYNTQIPAKSLYFRKQLCVRSDEGSSVIAWAYVLNPQKLPSNATRLEGGDWIASGSASPLIDQLTERQRNYIRRLGSSSGREIIPIDLDLYRELMKLEMIVDKGRRLALSKLGHEVFRYLG